MSRISTEAWDRKKKYLIRSLFENIPLLSPTPEIPQEKPSEPLSLTELLNRPYSPLPELIIEKEPTRHDDSEEYYDVLEKKMLKLYNKWFPKKQLLSEMNETRLFLDLDKQINTDLDESSGNTKADQNELHSEEVLQRRTEQDAISGHQSESFEEPDIIRRRNTADRPRDSINVLDNESNFSSNCAEEVEKIFTNEFEVAEELALNLTGNVYTSTPTAEIEDLESNQNRCVQRRPVSRTSLDDISLSPKRTKFENLVTQTSFTSSSEDSAWQKIKTPFLMGKQVVYKLCACRNHICHQ